MDFLSLRFEEAANVEGNPIEAYFNRYYKCLSHPITTTCGRIGWANGLGTSDPGRMQLLVADGEVLRMPGPDPVIENGLIVGDYFLSWRFG